MTTNNLVLYTPSQVAEILHMHVDNVKRLLRSGEIKGIKLGNRWRVDSRDLLEYVDKKRGV